MPIVNFHITGGAAQLQMTLTVRDNSNGNLLPGTQQHKCLLPALSPQLRDRYQLWRQIYNNWLGGMATLTPSSPPIDIQTNVSVLEKCQKIGEEFIDEFNSWINHASIKTALVNIVSNNDYCLNPSDFCFILHADTIDPELNLTLQRLPFHTWDFIQEFYPDAEITLSTTHHALSQIEPKRVQILVVLGYDPNIDLAAQQIAIGKRLIDANLADVTYWNDGSQSDPIASLYQKLKTSSPQILFFIGHSKSTNGLIRIWLNETEFISPEHLVFKNIFRGLKSRGLIFSAWISCDGLGIAQELSDLGIPYVMVSREILPVHVAKEFLDEFLAKATEPGVPIHIALSHARQHLQVAIEPCKGPNGCPNASTFPVIFQIPNRHSYILNPKPKPKPKPVDLPWWKFLLDRYLNWNRDMKITPITYLSLGASFIGIFIGIKFLLAEPKACDRNSQDNPHLSCGDKVLLTPPAGKSREDKQKGMEAFKKGNYPKAIADLQRDWNVAKDPETAIVLENAKIANDKNAKFKTIAVVIPATQTPIFVPTGILKGVAYAQIQWNQDPKHSWKLRVAIADDANDPLQAQDVATEILKRDDILAVVGHYSSQVTTNVRSLYQQAQTVLISGTSTATELTTNDPNTFFFRTCSSNRVTGAIMAHNWASKHKKIAIFYTPGKKFSESIRGAFINNLQSVAVVKEFNLSTPANAKTELAIAKKLGATGIVLFPDAYTAAIERDRVSSLIIANNGELPLLANETVNDDLLLKFAPKLIDKMTLSLPWHPSDIHHQNYQLFQAAPNWWGTKKDLNFRIVMIYDAANVLLTALDKSDSRDGLKQQKQQLQRVISSPIFMTTGITSSKINFNGSDRDDEINSLVKPLCTSTQCQGFKPAF